jgi:hypothetical protein
MAEPIDPDDLTEEFTAALVEAHKEGQADGVNALRNLRERLELVDAPTVQMRTAAEISAFRFGFDQAIQACRAEAATVLANLVRSVTP